MIRSVIFITINLLAVIFQISGMMMGNFIFVIPFFINFPLLLVEFERFIRKVKEYDERKIKS